MSPPKLSEVYRTYKQPESVTMAAVMRQHGLTPVVLGETLAALSGMGIYVQAIRIMVPRAQLLKARALVAIVEAESEMPITDSLLQCPSCESAWEPGFEVCWQCQAQRPPALAS